MSNLLYLLLTSITVNLHSINSGMSISAVGINDTNHRECKCMKVGKNLLYILNEDTLEVEEKFLFSNDLKYQMNSSLDSGISKAKVPLFNKDSYCYSDKFILKDGYYLIQVVSSSGFTSQYILGNSLKRTVRYYTVAMTEGFEDRIYVEDFINILREVSSKRQIEKLNSKLNVVTNRNLMRFPLFAH